MTTLAVLTSGGDAPGMNTAIRAVVKLAAGRGVRVLGVENGYDGLIDGRFRELTEVRGDFAADAQAAVGESGEPRSEAEGTRIVRSDFAADAQAAVGESGEPRSEAEGTRIVRNDSLGADYDVDRMGGFGGTVLGSARSERFRTESGRAEAARRLTEVDGLLVIGGNGSLTGAHLLAAERGVRVVGVPASIDNDIGCTGMAIGVDTALNTIVEACDRISDTARAHRRAFIVEVMGRDCGYLAMASSVAAGADAVLFREQGRDDQTVVERVAMAIREGFAPERNKRRVLIIKSEGVRIPCTDLVRRVSEQLGGSLPGVEVRATVLGHLVRGGAPSYYDRNIAGRLAFGGLSALLAGASDEMVAWQSPFGDGEKTLDPHVTRFSLGRVLEETAALLDGSSPITQKRVALVEGVEGILGL